VIFDAISVVVMGVSIIGGQRRIYPDKCYIRAGPVVDILLSHMLVPNYFNGL